MWRLQPEWEDLSEEVIHSRELHDHKLVQRSGARQSQLKCTRLEVKWACWTQAWKAGQCGTAVCWVSWTVVHHAVGTVCLAPICAVRASALQVERKGFLVGRQSGQLSGGREPGTNHTAECFLGVPGPVPSTMQFEPERRPAENLGSHLEKGSWSPDRSPPGSAQHLSKSAVTLGLVQGPRPSAAPGHLLSSRPHGDEQGAATDGVRASL